MVWSRTLDTVLAPSLVCTNLKAWATPLSGATFKLRRWRGVRLRPASSIWILANLEAGSSGHLSVRLRPAGRAATLFRLWP